MKLKDSNFVLLACLRELPAHTRYLGNAGSHIEVQGKSKEAADVRAQMSAIIL